jgi:very-short-patch-repair endonuclease
MSITHKDRETVLWYSIKNMKQSTFEEFLLWEVLNKLVKLIPINLISQQALYEFKIEKFYLVDFLIIPCGLIIEVDGSQHDSSQIEYDSHRDSYLKKVYGLETIRFDNSLVRNNLKEVVITILHAIGKRINFKPPVGFYRWFNACKKKEKQIIANFTHEDWKKLKELSKKEKIHKEFLKLKTKFHKDYIDDIVKDIQKQMFLDIK